MKRWKKRRLRRRLRSDMKTKWKSTHFHNKLGGKSLPRCCRQCFPTAFSFFCFFFFSSPTYYRFLVLNFVSTANDPIKLFCVLFFIVGYPFPNHWVFWSCNNSTWNVHSTRYSTNILCCQLCLLSVCVSVFELFVCL